MIVYVDVLVAENFIVNLFLLTLTMKCVRHKCSTLMMIVSGIIGGVYTLVLIIPSLRIFSSLPFELLVACLMLRIAYGKTSIINLIKLLFIFLMITFMLSGLCFLFSLKQNKYILGQSFELDNYSIKYIIIGAMSIYIVTERIVQYIKDRNFVNNYIYTIEFEVENKEYKLNGFLDTGNELREPVTNLPCILVEEHLIYDINFKNKNTYSIPYSSIGYGGSLKGIRVNNIKIKGRDLWQRELDAIICPCKQKLSKENEFNVLLSRGIV